MSKTAEIIRLTNELANLKERISTKDVTIGTLQSELSTLRNDIYKAEDKVEQSTPQVKVVHYNNRYDEYDDTSWQECSHKEYVNLDTVKEQIKKDFLKDAEMQAEENKRLIKELRNNVEVLQDTIDRKERQMSKVKGNCKEEVKDLEEKQEKEISKLNKAYDEDVKNYKDEIKDLKEEIKKVKEDKTDIEVEKKRNQEIETLKLRIKDLERILKDLKGASFFQRLTKLRKIELEQNKAAQELEQRERDARNIGKTWVKNEGKYRKFDSFKDNMVSRSNTVLDWIIGTANTCYNSYRPW